jgi:hypothetical protein
MNLLERLKRRRAEKRADREAIAKTAQEMHRAGDDETKSISETVNDVAGQFPPAP